MSKKELTLDDLVPFGDEPHPTFEDNQDWSGDERAAVKLAAQAIHDDLSLTLEEKFDFLLTVIMRPINRGRS